MIQRGEAIKCFKSLDSGSSAEACDMVTDKVDTIGDGFYIKFWRPLKNSFFNKDNWIDEVGGWLRHEAGIDLTSQEDTKDWIKEVAMKIGADFDTSGNCYIVYDKNGFEVEERECGALGEIGKIGSQVVDWLQGGEFTINRLWENSACFTKPGAKDKEICICNKDGCNKDVASARKASGINENARASVCNGKECPLVNLKKINEQIDFNSACYTTGDSEEKCFSTDILKLPKLGKLTRATRDAGDVQLTNIDGEANSGARKTVW